MTTSWSRPKRVLPEGFSLVEVLVAASLLAVGALALLRAHLVAVRMWGAAQDRLDRAVLMQEASARVRMSGGPDVSEPGPMWSLGGWTGEAKEEESLPGLRRWRFTARREGCSWTGDLFQAGSP